MRLNSKTKKRKVVCLYALDPKTLYIDPTQNSPKDQKIQIIPKFRYRESRQRVVFRFKENFSLYITKTLYIKFKQHPTRPNQNIIG